MTAEVARGCRRLGIAAIVLLLIVPAYGQTMSEFERLSVLARARTNEGLRLPAVSAGQMANRPLLRLSLDEAVELALDQNLDIRVQRLNPLIQDLSIANVRSAWAPNLSTTFQNNSRTTPSTTQLSGGLDQINTDTFQNTVGLNQLTPWGGFYNVNWNSSNQSTTNFFTSFDPQLRSTMSLQYTQPLLRNFTIDNVRQRLQITRTNRDISDIQLRDTIVSTVRNAKNAYWELSFAISALAVQQQSLELAEESLTQQPHASRSRHHGADRHRGSPSGSRPERGNRDRGGGGDRRGGRRVARPDHGSDDTELLGAPPGADRHPAAPDAGDRHRCGRRQRSGRTNRPGADPAQPRQHRHEHPVLPRTSGCRMSTSR